MEVGQMLFDAKSRKLFERDMFSVPCNGFVRDFFQFKLAPMCGYRTNFKALSEALDASWRIFVFENPHYRGAADEFKMPLVGYAIITDTGLAEKFVNIHLRRQMMYTQVAELPISSDMYTVYANVMKPFQS